MTHGKLNAIKRDWQRIILRAIDDFSALVAAVERLTLERDAAVADLREAIAASCDDECRFCRHANSPECAACNAAAENKWEWRGAREAANG